MSLSEPTVQNPVYYTQGGEEGISGSGSQTSFNSDSEIISCWYEEIRQNQELSHSHLPIEENFSLE